MMATTRAANATDDVGVTSLQFELDGAVVSTLTAAPWTFALTVSEGAHVLVAIAFDASGKQARSSVVTFTATAGEAPTLEPERVVGGCGCSTDANALSALELLALAGFWAKRRRTR
jgi:MYXO-CTERM domain-containing protein